MGPTGEEGEGPRGRVHPRANEGRGKGGEGRGVEGKGQRGEKVKFEVGGKARTVKGKGGRSRTGGGGR